MKTLNLFFIAVLFIFTSCAKDNSLSENLIEDQGVEERSSTDCRSCKGITATVEYKKVNGCYNAKVIVKTPELFFCRQSVYINNTFAGYLTEDGTAVYNYQLCDDKPLVYKIYGYNESTKAWTDVCLEKELKSPKKESLGKMNVNSSLDKNGQATINYQVENTSDVPLYLYDSYGTTWETIAPKSIKKGVKYLQGMNNKGFKLFLGSKVNTTDENAITSSTSFFWGERG